MIAIGAQYGGPELNDSSIKKALRIASLVTVKSNDDDFEHAVEGWINPVYIVPGSVLNPEFDGYKLGHFSKKKKGLVVQIAVPQAIADGAEIPEFIVSSLRRAVEIATAHFTKHNISFSILEAEKIILAIERELSKP